MKQDLLFYSEYEEFYAMAEASEAFSAYCQDAFGEDFSQDGFSDVRQINRILPYIPAEGACILDVGCGNGKMLRYLQRRTGASIFGFDYADNAIRTARAIADRQGEFTVGVMGEIDYPAESFHVVTAMDTLYFAPDMTAFVGQIRRWLKQGGTLCAGYQEGDVMPRTAGAHETVLAKALKANGMPYEVEDITLETYSLMHRKREAALRHKDAFLREGHQAWFDLLMAQTEHCLVSEEAYCRDNARYFYAAGKQ